MKQTRTPPEAVSALADGALQGEAFAEALDGIAQDADAQDRWSRYHLIGEALRHGHRACAPADPAFVARLQARLAAEPAAPRWADAPLPERAAAVPAAVPEHRRIAANADGFRWKMVAGLASVAAVAAIGWNLLGAGAPGAGGAALADANGVAGSAVRPVAFQAPARTASAVVPTADGPQVMLRDRRLDELLAAHRETGGAPGLQSPGSFVRNASFETADPGAAGR
ncbi:MAG: sigma-E factor negative regulatory protein [Xylophilus ampelinus]